MRSVELLLESRVVEELRTNWKLQRTYSSADHGALFFIYSQFQAFARLMPKSFRHINKRVPFIPLAFPVAPFYCKAELIPEMLYMFFCLEDLE